MFHFHSQLCVFLHIFLDYLNNTQFLWRISCLHTTSLHFAVLYDILLELWSLPYISKILHFTLLPYFFILYYVTYFKYTSIFCTTQTSTTIKATNFPYIQRYPFFLLYDKSIIEKQSVLPYDICMCNGIIP